MIKVDGGIVEYHRIALPLSPLMDELNNDYNIFSFSFTMILKSHHWKWTRLV